DLLGDGVAGEEGEAEAFAGGALDRLARAELPDAPGADPDRAELLVDHRLGARAGLACEQHELRQPAGWQLAVLELREAGLRHADNLVLEEGLELDPVVGRGCADERELDAAAEQPVEDLAAGGDLDLDRHGRIAAAEAAERVGQDVDAGGGRGAEMDRPGLEAGEGIELFFGG